MWPDGEERGEPAPVSRVEDPRMTLTKSLSGRRTHPVKALLGIAAAGSGDPLGVATAGSGDPLGVATAGNWQCRGAGGRKIAGTCLAVEVSVSVPEPSLGEQSPACFVAGDPLGGRWMDRFERRYVADRLDTQCHAGSHIGIRILEASVPNLVNLLRKH